MSLRDDLFLLAHDDSGRLVIHEAAVNAGLGGATVIDLLLLRRIAVEDGRLAVVDATPTGDPIADQAVAEIRVQPEPCGPRALISWLADGMYARVTAMLVASGAVHRTTVRKLGVVPVTRTVPTRPESVVRVRARLRYALYGQESPDVPTAALCSLARVVRLEAMLYLSIPTGELLGRMDRMTALHEEPVRQVVAAVDAVVATHAIAIHR